MLAAGAIASLAAAADAEAPGSKGKAMKHHATGTFDVKMQPLPEDEKVPGLKVARFGFDKQWKGDLEGSSKGEMMATNSGDKGSGGYVAVEQIGEAPHCHGSLSNVGRSRSSPRPRPSSDAVLFRWIADVMCSTSSQETFTPRFRPRRASSRPTGPWTRPGQ